MFICNDCSIIERNSCCFEQKSANSLPVNNDFVRLGSYDFGAENFRFVFFSFPNFIETQDERPHGEEVNSNCGVLNFVSLIRVNNAL